ILKYLNGSRPKGQPARRFRPRLEGLEGRDVPAFITPLATLTSSNLPVTDPVTASSRTGAHLTVFVEHFDNFDPDIKGQLTTDAGTKVNFNVTLTGDQENQPAVAMDDNGNFVVAWTDRFLFHSTNIFGGDVVTVGQGDIKAQRFDAAGHKLGGVISVASST